MENENDESGSTQRVPEMTREGRRVTDSSEAAPPPMASLPPPQQSLKRRRDQSLESPDSTEDLPSLPIFPQEIVIEIISRLPVKSLIRFGSVCKSWKTLISDPHFVRNHLKKSTVGPNFTGLRIMMISSDPLYNIKSCSLYSVYNNPYSDAIELDYPLKNQYRYERIVGSCDGLVCVEIGRDVFHLWNPSLGLNRILPNSGFDHQKGSRSAYGFGYDCSTDDYKVLGLFCFPKKDQRVNGNERETQVKIYSLRTNSWRRIQDCAYNLPYTMPGAFVNGTLNWMMFHKNDSDHMLIIISFDLAKETYQQISHPPYESTCANEKPLGELGGCLCMVCSYVAVRADVWVMKELGVTESWTKLVTIPYGSEPRFWPYLPPLFISKDGDTLLVRDSFLMLYNSKDNTLTHPLVHGARPCFEAVIYIESLVSPNAENQPQHQ